tara:strand:- start:120 stop:572 length:453 start_codon:yes stop_codon:yes gene_type:complete
MKKKIIYLLFSLLILNNCGFSPIYSNTNKADFAIEVVEIEGDGVVNNLINSEINRISDTNSLNRYKIKITTNYNKIILSKDTKGIVSDYQIVVSATFAIQKDGESEVISFNEKQNVKNINNTFEQKNYEKIIKRNFAISIVRKLNLELLN